MSSVLTVESRDRIGNAIQEFANDQFNLRAKDYLIDALRDEELSEDELENALESIRLVVIGHNFPGCLPESEPGILYIPHDEEFGEKLRDAVLEEAMLLSDDDETLEREIKEMPVQSFSEGINIEVPGGIVLWAEERSAHSLLQLNGLDYSAAAVESESETRPR